MTNELLDAVAELPKVCEHIEVPNQAGDDEVLQRMKREYTMAEYSELVARIRDRMAEVCIAWSGEPRCLHPKWTRQDRRPCFRSRCLLPRSLSWFGHPCRFASSLGRIIVEVRRVRNRGPGAESGTGRPCWRKRALLDAETRDAWAHRSVHISS